MASKFYNVALSNKYSYGATVSTYYPTNDVVTQSGRSQRTVLWKYPKHRFTISYDKRREQEIKDIYALYLQTFGPAIPFLFDNVLDNEVLASSGVANEDGKLKGKPFFALFKKYSFDATLPDHNRRIFKPFNETVKIFDDGIEMTGLTINYLDGTVQLPLISQSKIIAITKEVQAKITTLSNHTFLIGDRIFLTAIFGMTQINNLVGTVTQVIDLLNFKVNINTLNYSTFVNDVDVNKNLAQKYITGNEKISWSGKFYVPVHFIDETLSQVADGFNSQSTTFTLEEDFLEENNKDKLDD